MEVCLDIDSDKYTHELKKEIPMTEFPYSR